MGSPETSNAQSAAPRDRARHKWFPVLVLALAAAWWIRQSVAMGYTTLFHVLVVLGSAVLLAFWFVRWGPCARERGSGSRGLASRRLWPG